jgi:uncharacterized protein (DUF433 family)
MTHDRVEINPAIMFGGMMIDEILADHPHLTPDDIYAAAFAADYLAQEEIVFAGGESP